MLIAPQGDVGKKGQINPILEAFCVSIGSKQSQERAVGLKNLFLWPSVGGGAGGNPLLAPLTAEGWRPPLLHVDAVALAFRHVGSDGFAQGVPVAFVVAGVESAILEERRGVDDVVASPEGPPSFGDHPAIAVAAVKLFLYFVAHRAIPHATSRATGDVSHLPAIGQLDFIRRPFTVAGDEVVAGVAVGVAAEAADGAGVVFREDDAGVAVPVEAHPQAEGGAGKAVDAAVVELELVLLGERELHEDAVDLEKVEGAAVAPVSQRLMQPTQVLGQFLGFFAKSFSWGRFPCKSKSVQI